MLTKLSMNFNGEYIENLIDGYTTTGVSGREMAGISLDTLELGTRDGSILRGKKYDSRTLTINFCIQDDDPWFGSEHDQIIDRMNQLNSILDTEGEVRIIFADEPDKFYMGMRTGSPQATMSLGVITGSFDIFCSTPFKYSVEEFEAVPSFQEENGAQTFVIDYGGTYKSYPAFITQFYTQETSLNLLDVTEDDSDENDEDDDSIGTIDTITSGSEFDNLDEGVGDCGYVAFFDDDEHILQFGNPQMDGKPDPVQSEQQLLYQSFKNQGNWSDAVKKKFLETQLAPPGWVVSGGSRYFGIGPSYNNKISASTSRTILKHAEGNNVYYTLAVVANNRSATTVKLNFTLKGKILKELVPEAELVGTINVFGTSHSFTIKKAEKSKTGKPWKKGKTWQTTHSFTVEVSDEEVAEITGIKFRVARSGTAYKTVKNKKGKKEKQEIKESYGKLATKNCEKLPIPTYIAPKIDTYYLAPASYGSGINGKFYGPAIEHTIKADSLGNLGSTDYYLEAHIKMCIGDNDVFLEGKSKAKKSEQLGGFYLMTVGANNKILAWTSVEKSSNGSTGVVKYGYGSTVLKTETNVDLSYTNNNFGIGQKNVIKEVVKNTKKTPGSVGSAMPVYKTTVMPIPIGNKTAIIRKEGSIIEFMVGTRGWRYTKAPAADKVYKVVFGAGQYSGKPMFDWLGLYDIRFEKRNVKPAEEPVPFHYGDFLVADSSTGEITVNNVSKPYLGALGNDWEQMYLVPGVNQFSTSYSDWAKYTVYRQCSENDIFDKNTQYYTPVLVWAPGLTESVYNQNPGHYWIVNSTDYRTFVRCTTSMPFDSQITYCQAITYNPEIVPYTETPSPDDPDVMYVTSTTFDENPARYFVKEEATPHFRIRYREVYV